MDVFEVRTLKFQESVREKCLQRNDEWGKAVLGRLEYAQDLPAVEARYHQSCSTNFRSGCNIPVQYQIFSEMTKNKKGRPLLINSESAFLEVIKYFESNPGEQVTVNELLDKMSDRCEQPYSFSYMKKRILDHFGGSVVISELDGKRNVITFKNKADAILHSFYQRNNKQDSESEKMAVIKTAATLILSDIKSIADNKEEYPNPEKLKSLEENRDYVPESLLTFLKQIIDHKNSEKKILSIGQAIIQACMPRGVIAPLQIGLGVQMHHLYGSKLLIEILNSMGFCSSYTEIQRFESSAASSQGTSFDLSDEQFVQYVADNVDHNTGTLDGHNTFHGMGIIAAVTPQLVRTKSVPRVRASAEDLVAVGKVNIYFYTQSGNRMEELKFRKLIDLSCVEDTSEKLDFIFKIGRSLKIRMPSWSGIMQMVQTGVYPGQSSIVFLPILDLNPSDMSCVYSTLRFVSAHAQNMNVTPIVTFDQPLYWKAITIVFNEPSDSEMKSLIVRLGGFHTEMSFLGCVGQLMENTGLEELLCTVYAPNTVSHMLSGKAIARAIRGHFLVDDALNTVIVKRLIPSVGQICDQEMNDINQSENRDSAKSSISERNMNHENTSPETNEENNGAQDDVITDEDTCDMEYIKEMIEKVLSKDMCPQAINDDKIVQSLMQKFAMNKCSLKSSRTASLWIQYMDMIDILRRFIKAERTGNWKLHLKSMQEMLPFFAAAGHNLYLKSGYVYLQEMTDLERTNPGVYRLFMSGNHVVRRSDRFWAGLSTDLVIEQALMRSVKSAGGMTRGRGMTESQRALWLLSMPACAEINDSMQEFTGQKTEASDQHKEAYDTRLQRDQKDRKTFLSYLEEKNPFASEKSLRNIETGALADKRVNADSAKSIGLDIIADMEEKKVLEYTFKKKKQAVTLGTKQHVKVDGEEVNVDPQLLFQRLISVSESTLDNVEEIFKYELCGHPSALFDSSGLLREAQKPALAHAIWELGGCGVSQFTAENVHYVLDGGSLVQRISWAYGAKFDSICEDYVNLIVRNYGHPHIVFDGYSNGPTTKDVTHERRVKGVIGTRVLFNGWTTFKSKKELFLSNQENKQDLINLLGSHLLNKGCKVTHAPDDADVLIAMTAIKEASNAPTVVIGEDTDVLILLCHHANDTEYNIYYMSDTKSSTKKKRIWDIKRTRNILGNGICKILPVLHAFSGCDTASRIYGIGKGILLKKALSEQEFRDLTAVFLQDATHNEIEKAGESLFVRLYNGHPDQSLDELRFQKFIYKVNTSTTYVQVQSLPPTQAAAKFHSYRVYLQVQNWLGKNLIPVEWGWCKKKDKLSPVKTLLPAAPERLLKIIRCSCTQNCDTKRCSCRKHGLTCSAGCGGCRGTSCSNIRLILDETD